MNNQPSTLLRAFLLLITLSPYGLLHAQNALEFSDQEQDAGAVILLKRSDIHVHANRLASSDNRLRIAILNKQAADDFTQMRLHYNEHFETLKLISASVTHADGHRSEVSQDAIQIVSSEGDSHYDDIKTLSFALPALEADSIIELHWQRRDTKHSIDGHWLERWRPRWIQPAKNEFGVRLDPVRQALFRVTTDPGVQYQRRLLNPERLTIDEKRIDTNTHQWTARKIPAQLLEEHSYRWADQQSLLRLSTLTQWDQLDAWADKHYGDKLRPSAKVRQLADTIRQQAPAGANKQQLTEAAFYYLQNNIRYIGADVARGGLIPHAPDDVIRHRYGDCKDQSTLMASLLTSLGIEAYPALIGTRGNSSLIRDFPANYFDHMIVYIPKQPGLPSTWLDNAGDTGQFPGVSSAISGRDAFVLNRRGGSIHQVPNTDPKHNRLSIDYRFHIDDGALSAEAEVTATGQIGNRFKAIAAHGEQSRKDITDQVQRIYNKAKVTDSTFDDLHDPAKPFHARFKIQFDDQLDEHESFSYIVSADNILETFASPLIQFRANKQRRTDSRLSDPVTLSLRVHAPPPGDGYLRLSPKTGENAQTPEFRLRTRSETQGKDSIVQLEFSILKDHIPSSRYNAFIKALTKARGRSNTLIQYRYDDYRATTQALAEKARSGTITDVISLLEQQLESGEYENALKEAKQAIKRWPDDPKLNYLYGISLGFNDDDEGSEQAIGHAIELGYEP